MQIKFSSTVLIVNDLELMKDFYVNILNCELLHDFGTCLGFKNGISLWKLTPELKITKSRGYTWNGDKNKNLELVFETDEFDSTLKEIKKHKLNLLHDVNEETWGQKTIRFYDPESNLIELGETLSAFVNRLKNEGMNIEQIVKKTGIDKQLVLNLLKI